MLFALICTDKPGYLQTRMDARPDHVAFLDGLGSTLKAAGPFLCNDGKPIGSMLIIQAEDSAAAHAIASLDPYATVGLFSNVEIKPWNWVFKNPEAA